MPQKPEPELTVDFSGTPRTMLPSGGTWNGAPDDGEVDDDDDDFAEWPFDDEDDEDMEDDE